MIIVFNSIFITLFTVLFLSVLLWWCDCLLSECDLYNKIAGKYDIKEYNL